MSSVFDGGHGASAPLPTLRQRAGYNPIPHFAAVCTTQSRYSVSGVTPVMPPQPAAPFGPVDQLTTPITTGPACLSSKTGAPESPVQAPSPSRAPCPTGSTNLICNVPGLPVATRLATRMVPPLLPSPRTVTPMPAIVKRLPTLIGIFGSPSAAGVLPLGGAANCSKATSAVARCPRMACMLKPG